MERRDFLGCTLAAVSAGGAAAAALPGQPPAYAVKIGRAVLAEGSLPADAAALRTELGAGTVPVAELFARDWTDRIGADLAAHRMIHVGGWGLTFTEAALCALAAQG